MKKLFVFIITISILLVSSPQYSLQAAEIYTETTYMDNGDFIESTIIIHPQNRSSNTRTATKTSTYKNSNNESLLSVSVTATFLYETGKSCTCISASGNSKSYVSEWKVTSATTSKSGNTAKSTITGTHFFIGIAVNSYDLTVKLTCDTYGNLS